MVGTKRRRDEDDVEEGTPRKLRAHVLEDTADEQETSDAQTPSKRSRAQQLAVNGT
jgi:origin recognition complex subunit 2